MRKWEIGCYRCVLDFGEEYTLVQTDTEVAAILEGESVENPDGYNHLFVLVGDAEFSEIWGSYIPYIWREAELLWKGN